MFVSTGLAGIEVAVVLEKGKRLQKTDSSIYFFLFLVIRM